MYFLLRTQPSSEETFYSEFNEDAKKVEFDEESPVRHLVSHLPSSGTFLRFTLCSQMS